MSAPSHGSGGKLFKEGLTIEEKAHHLLLLPNDVQLSPSHLNEYQQVRMSVLSWLDRSTKQYDSMWRLNQSKYPKLKDVTPLNFEEKRKELAGQVPSFVWTPLEEIERIAEHKKEIERKPLPAVSSAESHGDHKEHAPHEPHPQYLDHDPRYQKMVLEKVDEWNKEHPSEKITESPLYQREDGSVYINPAVLSRMPSLETEVRTSFSEKYADDYKHYEINEASRIYRDKEGKANPENDPRYKKLQSNIEEKTKEAKEQYEKDIKEKTAAEAAKNETYNAKSKLAAIKYTKKEVNPEKIEQSLRQQHLFSEEETKKQIEREQLKQFAKENPLKAKAYSEMDPLILLAYEEVIREEAREKAEKEVAHKVAEGMREYTQSQADEIIVPPEQVAVPSSTPTSPGVPNKRSRPSVSPSMLRNAFGGGEEGASGMGSRLAQGAGRGLQSMGEGLGSGAQSVASGATRLGGSLAAKAAPLLANPYVIGAIIIILFFILIWIILSGGNNQNPTTAAIPVSITKTGPATVENGAEIPYTITVSYPGTATDIIITDPLPTGTQLVPEKTTGKYTCDPSPCGPTTTTVTWKATDQVASSAGALPPPPGSNPNNTPSPSSTTIDIAKYSQSPYFLPPPSGPSDVKYSASDMTQLNEMGGFVAKHQSYLVSKTGGAQYVDPFLSVIWSAAVEGINGNNYFWNCQDTSHDINAGCPNGYYSGRWEVSYGFQVFQAVPNIVDDFNEVYGPGSANDATKTQQVGQAVISASGGKITNPSTFPNSSVSQLVSQAGSSTDARQALAILMMDKELGAVEVAREIAGDIATKNNWAATMEGWNGGACGFYCQNMQNFSNRMAELAKSYTGTGGAGGATFGTMTFTLTLLPTSKLNDTYIVNTASAQVLGGSGGGGGAVQGTPTTLTAMFQQAAQKYKVPVAFLMAINKLETDVIDTWTDADVQKFSVLNWWVNASQADIQKGWAFNQCDTLPCRPGADVRGIMQFELDTWNGVAPQLTFADGHTPDRRYPLDSILGGGILISGIAAQYDQAFGTQPNGTDWTQDKVRKVSTAYCTGSLYGDPNSPACNQGGAPYDDIIWKYYQQYKSQGL